MKSDQTDSIGKGSNSIKNSTDTKKATEAQDATRKQCGSKTKQMLHVRKTG
jgi:hypothetical protein